jgi:hypothetical protein
MLIMLLVGCGIMSPGEIASLPPEQLAKLSDHDICRGLALYRSNANLLAEAQRRDLGDCSADHFLCLSWGAKPGSPEYARCRADMARAHLLPRSPVAR